MNKRVLALIACTLFAKGCSTESRRDRMTSSMSSIASTQDRLNEDNQRINELKQELLKQGFGVAASDTSDSKEQVILKGRYGKLKDIEVTLWTGKQLEIREPHSGAIISATITSDEAEREFRDFSSKVSSIVEGRPQ